MEKILGVVGGLGPEAGLEFCKNVTKRAVAQAGSAPHIFLDSISFPKESMAEFAHGGEPEGGKEAILSAISRLNSAGASAIAIPCNTVHVFMDDLRAASDAPIYSIIDETASACKKLGVKKICLLATSKTINGRLYHSRLSGAGTRVFCPSMAEQSRLEGIIIRINCLEGKQSDYDEIASIAVSAAAKFRADLVVLGCTDLSPASGQIRSSGIKVADSLEELENAALAHLMGERS